ncbi:hypothetical protein FF1_000617 [Malus domestica]
MYGKAAFALIFAFLLLLTCSIFIGTVDIQSYFLPSSPPLLSCPSAPPPPRLSRSTCTISCTSSKLEL